MGNTFILPESEDSGEGGFFSFLDKNLKTEEKSYFCLLGNLRYLLIYFETKRLGSWVP